MSHSSREENEDSDDLSLTFEERKVLDRKKTIEILEEGNEEDLEDGTLLNRLIRKNISIEAALDMGADPNGKREDSDPPIFRALLEKDDMNLRRLIHRGANVNAKNMMGLPLIFLVRKIITFNLLVRNRVNVDVLVEGLDGTGDSLTNLYQYIKRKRTFSEEYRQHVINFFTNRSSEDIERSIKTYGNKVIVLINEKPHTPSGFLLIHIAVEKDDIPYAEALLKSGADPNAYYTQDLLDLQGEGKSPDYMIPLHKVRSVQMVELLKEYGAYMNGINESPPPILSSRSIDIFGAFVDNGADFDGDDEDKVTENIEEKIADNYSSEVLSRILRGESVSNLSLAKFYLNSDQEMISSDQIPAVISHGNPEEKSILEHILLLSSVRDLIKAIKKGADPMARNLSGKDLMSVYINDYLKVKIFILFNIGSIHDAKKYATKPRIIDLLNQYS